MGNPDTTFITVPNVPFLTGMRKIRDYGGLAKSVGINVLKKGLATPFINISFSGLLWGYEDELPCNSLPRPDECGAAEGEVDLFADDGDDEDGEFISDEVIFCQRLVTMSECLETISVTKKQSALNVYL